MFIPERVNKLVLNLLSTDENLKTKDVAMRLHIPRVTLDKVKSGRVDPQISTVEKIAIGFGVDMNYFFDNEGWNPEPDPGTEEPNLEEQNNNLNEPSEPYSNSKLMHQLIDMQQKYIDSQTELYELKIENERLKNAYAPNKTANAG